MVESSYSSEEEYMDDRETGDPSEESIQREELAKDGKDDCGGLGRGIKYEVFGKGIF
jgi:hypothetical protein